MTQAAAGRARPGVRFARPELGCPLVAGLLLIAAVVGEAELLSGREGPAGAGWRVASECWDQASLTLPADRGVRDAEGTQV